MNYAIGQCLYHVTPSPPGIVVVSVVKKIVEETVAGAETKYIVSLRGTTVPLETLLESGEVYTTSSEVKNILIERITKSIDEMIGAAEIDKLKIVSATLDRVEQQSNVPLVEKMNALHEVPDIPSTITLPDGTIAKVRVKA